VAYPFNEIVPSQFFEDADQLGRVFLNDTRLGEVNQHQEHEKSSVPSPPVAFGSCTSEELRSTRH
jgi:hypothetical protein